MLGKFQVLLLALIRVPIYVFDLFLNSLLLGGDMPPATDEQAQKFGEELADVMDLALDKISNKTQVNQFLKEGLDVYGSIAEMDLTDTQKGALAFHVAAAIVQRAKKYFPLNPPPAPIV